jgi:hypothetical protein
MVTATHKPTANLFRAIIREELARGAESGRRVDRVNCIVYGVKVVHRKSVNTHNVPGAKSSEYTREALANAISLYEGLKVNVDHPPKDRPGKERSAYDRIGKLKGVHIGGDGDLYGNLHLVRSHKMTASVMDSAETADLNDLFALSHNAVGKGKVINGVYTISEIPEVRSVDLVADGGTNVSLYESQRTHAMIRKGLRKALAESSVAPKLRKRIIREAEEYAPDLMDDVEDPEEPGWMDHLANAISCLVGSGDPDDHGKASSLLKAVKPVEEDEEDEKDEGDEEDEKDDKKVKTDKADMEDEEETKPRGKENTKDDADGKESPLVKSRESLARENRQLKDRLDVTDLCESMEFTPSPIQRKALVALRNKADRKAYIEESKRTRKTSAPRSGAGGGYQRDTTEGRQDKPKSTQGWTSRLLGR